MTNKVAYVPVASPRAGPDNTSLIPWYSNTDMATRPSATLAARSNLRFIASTPRYPPIVQNSPILNHRRRTTQAKRNGPSRPVRNQTKPPNPIAPRRHIGWPPSHTSNDPTKSYENNRENK